MKKTGAEKQIIAMQTEAEFAADVSRLKRDRWRLEESIIYQKRAAEWAEAARNNFVSLLQP